MSLVPQKIFIKVESSTEQQENLKNSRKSLKVLQKTSTDKENLVGRSSTHAFVKSKSETEINDGEIKRKKLVTHASQTDPERLELAKITEEDLTTDGEPSEGYWKVLAEKRRVALDQSLRENEELYEEVHSLRDQLEISNQMLDESKNLVEILTEMLEENEQTDEKDDCAKELINASLAEEASEDVVALVLTGETKDGCSSSSSTSLSTIDDIPKFETKTEADQKTPTK